ncbi:nuclear transport factor 2 family protein [Phenylobacterium sp.]|uniref:nuclear transport factor 2 family protein n=1 Tax=Phenylobacterium sp. TaxID=1871053 RepID=UPI003D28B921
MRPFALLFLALVAGPALAQPARITDADVRAFAARQEQAWNAGDIDRYFAGFTPNARFTDQAYVGDKPPVPYGTSTTAQAREQARRTRGQSRERGEIRRIQIAPDGRSAIVTSRVGSVVQTSGKPRRLCASRVQTLVVSAAGMRATGQTDTFVKCSQ